MNNLKYQKDYWKSFITSSQEDMLAKDLNSSWDENSKSYSTPTEIPKPYLDYIKQDIKLIKVIDFGVGLGRNQQYLKSIFNDVHGFDLPEMIENYKKTTSKDSKLIHDVSEFDDNYSLLYETTVFQHMPPDEVIFYLTYLSYRAKYYFSHTRSYNDFFRNFKNNTGGVNIYHLIMATNCWEPISFSNNEINSLNDETHYFALYKSKNKNA
jgi:hypothetical protein